MSAPPSVKGRLTFTHDGCEHTTEVEIHGLLQTQLVELATLKRQHEQLRAAVAAELEPTDLTTFEALMQTRARLSAALDATTAAFLVECYPDRSGELMKTFEQAWTDTGRQYGHEELEGVKLGWDLAQAELVALKRQHEQLRAAVLNGAEMLSTAHPEHMVRTVYNVLDVLRAALDAITAEPPKTAPNPCEQLRAAAERTLQGNPNDARDVCIRRATLRVALDATSAEPENPLSKQDLVSIAKRLLEAVDGSGECSCVDYSELREALEKS